MPLSAGTRLGPYEILAPIGVGGMGEVYRAHDTPLPVEGSEEERKPIPFLQTEFNEQQAQLSPDSHWMAYTSDQSGRREVYVRPFPRAEGQWTVSVRGGQAPRWRGDGEELFYRAADGKMMAVPVKPALL